MPFSLFLSLFPSALSTKILRGLLSSSPPLRSLLTLLHFSVYIVVPHTSRSYPLPYYEATFIRLYEENNIVLLVAIVRRCNLLTLIRACHSNRTTRTYVRVELRWLCASCTRVAHVVALAERCTRGKYVYNTYRSAYFPPQLLLLLNASSLNKLAWLLALLLVPAISVSKSRNNTGLFSPPLFFFFAVRFFFFKQRSVSSSSFLFFP